MKLGGLKTLGPNYFRFGRAKEPPRTAISEGGEDGYPLLPIWAQYVGLALGVFVQPVVSQARAGAGSSVDLSFLTAPWFFLALVLGLILFPAVYRPQVPSPQPRFLQFCVVFGAGIGWQAIFDTIVAP